MKGTDKGYKLPPQNVLVVNGQKITLESAGGVGRYGNQLLKRLYSSASSKTFLDDVDLVLTNFQGNQEVVTNSNQTTSKKNIDVLKHMVSRCCPPFIFDRLQKLVGFPRIDKKSI